MSEVHYRFLSNRIIVKLLLCLFTLAFSRLTYPQARIIINNDVHVAMNGGTATTPIYLVVDNPIGNAISSAGSGGNLISENEYNIVRWNIGSNTDNYTLPYTTVNDVKIPFSIQVTTAGVGGTHIDFSTFSTSIMNNPRPSTVTHMLDALTATVDNSMWVIDRFWMVNAMNYTTRPETQFVFNYDPLETNGNSLVPGNMVAQRFDSSQEEWSGSVSLSGGTYGNDNLAQTRVESVSVINTQLHEAWTLVDRMNPLPVELTYFSAECMTDYVELNWKTASEMNASHFNVEQSVDGITWEVVTSIQAQGTASSTSDYSYRDYNPNKLITYYRLVQFDFDGHHKTYDAQSIVPCTENDLSIEVFNMSDNNFQVKIISPINQSFQLDILSISGQQVRETRTLNAVEGDNIYLFNGNGLSPGIYMIAVRNTDKKKTQKLIIN